MSSGDVGSEIGRVAKMKDQFTRLKGDDRLGSSACWDQKFDGDRQAAEKWVRRWYGKAGGVDRTADSTCFRFIGFWITIIEDRK